MLKKRRDFLAAARARRHGTPAMLVQARERRGEERARTGETARVGYTCSKKVGNAVTRNRAKRRLRAAAAAVLAPAARAGWDYVLIGRAGATVARPFAGLCTDLATALERLHAPARPSGKRRGPAREAAGHPGADPADRPATADGEGGRP
ncbi:MAG: ribonuclease P protein component [Pseudomonadota bacterium]